MSPPAESPSTESAARGAPSLLALTRQQTEERVVALGREAVPFAGSGDGEVRGELVFAGFGLRIDELDHDDYRDLDVRGRVVLVLRGAPGWRQSDSP